MKSKVFIIAAALLLAACSSEQEETVNESDLVEVRFGFKFDLEIDEFTRTELSAASSYLDVWVVCGDELYQAHQAKTDDGFGTVSFTLHKNHTYTLYAVAHKGNGAASLNNGLISFVDNKITDTFWYTTTFTPSTTTSISPSMSRIVGQFRMETADAVPDDVKKMRFTITDAFTKWAVTGAGSTTANRTATITISSTNTDGTAAFNIYLLASSTSANYDILAEALSATDEVLYSHQFTGMPIQNNYKTIVRGDFFTDDPTSMTFSPLTEWDTFATINF